MTAVERLHATRDSTTHHESARSAPQEGATIRTLVSGAQPLFDHAIASIAVRLFDTTLTHAQATAGTDEDRT